jgi:hypothetical protein
MHAAMHARQPVLHAWQRRLHPTWSQVPCPTDAADARSHCVHEYVEHPGAMHSCLGVLCVTHMYAPSRHALQATRPSSPQAEHIPVLQHAQCPCRQSLQTWRLHPAQVTMHALQWNCWTLAYVWPSQRVGLQHGQATRSIGLVQDAHPRKTWQTSHCRVVGLKECGHSRMADGTDIGGDGDYNGMTC